VTVARAIVGHVGGEVGEVGDGMAVSRLLGAEELSSVGNVRTCRYLKSGKLLLAKVRYLL
jgi:hypothetical protein